MISHYYQTYWNSILKQHTSMKSKLLITIFLPLLFGSAPVTLSQSVPRTNYSIFVACLYHSLCIVRIAQFWSSLCWYVWILRCHNTFYILSFILKHFNCITNLFDHSISLYSWHKVHYTTNWSYIIIICNNFNYSHNYYYYYNYHINIIKHITFIVNNNFISIWLNSKLFSLNSYI